MLTSNTQVTEKTKAPGIDKVLGAFFLDLGLLGLFWFIGMILVTAIWTVGVYLTKTGAIPNTQPSQWATMLMGVSSLYLSILIVCGARGRNLSLNPIPASRTSLTVLAITTGLAVCLLTILCTAVLHHLGLELHPGNQALLQETGKTTPVIIGLFTLVIAPVFEELLFRKQLFARFLVAGYTITGYLLSSVLFALMHEPTPTEGFVRWCLMLLLYAAMGGVFAWVYQKTGRLWPAILAHASNNLFAIGILLLA